MKRRITFALTLALLVATASLGATTAFADGPAPKTRAEDTVEVKKDGTEFDPKVDKSNLPDGAWYCDMGGVHYARMDKGDGQCDLCGMKLHQKGKKGEGHHGHGHHGHHGHKH